MGRLLPLALLVGFALGASAQEPPPEPVEDRVAPEAVPARAEELARELGEAGPAPEAQERLDRIETGLARKEPELDALEARVAAALAADVAFAELLDLRGELSAAAASLEGWQEELEDRGPEITALLTRLSRAEALWTRTQQHPETAEAGEVVVRRVQSALDLVAETSASLRAWRDRVLALEDRVAQRQARLAAASERLEETAKARRTTLLVPDRAPLFGGGFVPEIQAELRRLPGVLVEFPDENLDYVRRDARPLVLQILLATILALAFREAGRGARGDRFDASVAAETRVLERPISIGVLLALIATPWIHPLAPRRFIQLLALIALLPVARIIVHASPEASRLVLGGLFALLALDRLALAVQELPALAEALVMLELALGFALAVRVWRRGGIPADPRRVRGGARIVAAVLAVALLGELGGWSELATLLGRGAIVCVLLAVYVWAAVAGLDALFAWVLRPPRWRPRLGHAAVARRRAQRGVGWLGAAVWLYAVLGSVGLREPVLGGLRDLLAAGISVGALSLTLGGVLAFVLTLLAAPLVARLLNFGLEQGVYPRAHLPRGMPYALSTLMRYVVYTLAFVAALAAAGVQLGQLSILLGGLGVGVGLGLQDIVKNFAAGLTLLFERRVHVGDVVQLPSQSIFGRVLEIGMRASVVRNWDGAEVVVPNGDLVSASVTNWTLSDRLRRVELPVGVAYGSEPEQVVELLLRTAREQKEVLEAPAPQALFQGFGESSLDFLLRVWIDSDYDLTLAFRSELTLATHRALRDAGIEIPFPQRTLHLASVSPEARAALEDKKGE